jgi:hypothetical protein
VNMEEYIQRLRNDIAWLGKQHNTKFVVKQHENSVSIECDITEKAKHIFGENVIAKAVQHVATRHFKFDDEESVEETIKFLKAAASLYIVDELKLNEDYINLDPAGVTITFTSGNIVKFSCDEWGSIRRVKGEKSSEI